MNYATIKKLDVANGRGCRVSLFVSGCRNHCRGCFNPETWNFDYGNPFNIGTQTAILDFMNEDYIAGLSVLGGDPMEEENETALIPFLKRVRETYPDKNIWLYTGYVYEAIKKRPILKYVDVLVDGPFVLELKNPKLAFRGSENQRILKMRNGKIVKVLAEGKQEYLED